MPRVFIIVPSLPCAPGTGFPQMSRAQELLSRLIVIRDLLGEEIVAVRRPKLHLKANFFASPAGWEELLGDPGFADVFRVYIEQRAYQVGHHTTDQNVRDQAEALREAAVQWLQPLLEQFTPEQGKKIIYYLLVGSANQNYRSMMMDGEAMVVVAKWQSLYGLMDFIFMMGLCKWVDNLEELQKYLPPYNGFQRKVGRWLKNAL